MGNRPFIGRLMAVGCYSIPSSKNTNGLKLVGRHVEKKEIRMREQGSCCEDGGKYKAEQATQSLETLREVPALRCIARATQTRFLHSWRDEGLRRDLAG